MVRTFRSSRKLEADLAQSKERIRIGLDDQGHVATSVAKIFSSLTESRPLILELSNFLFNWYLEFFFFLEVKRLVGKLTIHLHLFPSWKTWVLSSTLLRVLITYSLIKNRQVYLRRIATCLLDPHRFQSIILIWLRVMTGDLAVFEGKNKTKTLQNYNSQTPCGHVSQWTVKQ